MNENRKFGALSSSTNPQELSATVSGAILSVSSLIIWGASYLGVPVGHEAISNFATQAGLAAGSLWFLFGIVRKAVVAINAKFNS